VLCFAVEGALCELGRTVGKALYYLQQSIPFYNPSILIQPEKLFEVLISLSIDRLILYC